MRLRYLEMSVNNIKDYTTHVLHRGECLHVFFFSVESVFFLTQWDEIFLVVSFFFDILSTYNFLIHVFHYFVRKAYL